MSKIVSSFLFTVLFISATSFAARASCEYNQVIEAQEFQIGIMLTWSTSFEANNHQFVIEKSDDGFTFQDIGSVAAKGDTELGSEYNFLHVYPREKRIFYRLKQIDNDGTYSYSDIAIFDKVFDADVQIARVSEVFTNDEFMVQLDCFSPSVLTYALHAWNGDHIYEEVIELKNGLNEINVEAKNLPVGIYQLQLLVNDELLDEITFQRIESSDDEKLPLVRKNQTDPNRN